ncbi:YcaO-like family protein [Mycobacterium sp. pW049]|uniref:YcaO-like family protein n=1 Tax=[Mycobacterium] bulgaricum TaxID=3238985 RepID=UPI00351B9B51
MDSFAPYSVSAGLHLAMAESAAVLQWDELGKLICAERELVGAGTDFGDSVMARTRAVAELIERQVGFLYGDLDTVIDRKSRLGSSAVDLERLPRCSDREYALPSCPLRPPDPDRDMEWIRARNLMTGERQWIPLSLVLLHGTEVSSHDRLMTPISTGLATHVNATEALLAAVVETIERDAIALTWEARLPLPQLAPECLTPNARAFLEADRQRGISTLLFDATTDIDEVAVVYCLQLDENNDDVAQHVHCAAALDVGAAAEKVLRESSSSRLAIARAAQTRHVASVEKITQLTDGAIYMGMRSRRDAFRFLMTESPTSTVSSRVKKVTSAEQLSLLVAQLKSLGIQLMAVDLTSRSARRYGLTVVKVLACGLLPFSHLPSARYRGVPRLYAYPLARFGKSLREDDLNPWPQPFA